MKAGNLLQSTLAHKMNICGAQHCFTLQRLDDLANIQYNAGNFEVAAGVLEELVDLKIRLFGYLNSSTLLSQNNLVIVRAARGSHHEAQYLHILVATERQKTLAPGHLELAVSLHSFGTVYCDQAQYQLLLGASHMLTICKLSSNSIAPPFAGRFEEVGTRLKPAPKAARNSLESSHLLCAEGSRKPRHLVRTPR